jgi:hypothetical protein
MLLFSTGELPTARLLSREPRERLAADTRRWATRQWRWLAPRTLPMLVAAFGLIGIIASGRYLSRLATHVPSPERTASLTRSESDGPIHAWRARSESDGPVHVSLARLEQRSHDELHLELWVCRGKVMDVTFDPNASETTRTCIDR